MIHAQTITGGRSRRDALIFKPHNSRHGAFLSARVFIQAKHDLLCLEYIWARLLDISYFFLLGIT